VVYFPVLDIKRIRSDPGLLLKALLKGSAGFDTDVFNKRDARRRELIFSAEQLKARQNSASKQIPVMKKQGGDVTSLLQDMKALSDEIAKMDEEIKIIEEEIEASLLAVPNIPSDAVPIGRSSEDNVEVRRIGDPRVFDFEPKAHWDLGESLDIIDQAAAARVTGARFVFYKGGGARLERSLINFMLDLHTSKHGYTEILPPYMVNRDSMVGTGQLPKFEEDAFKVAGTDYFLIPTAEVPVTNIFRGQILDAGKLPVKYAAYSACFRSEAGSAGRDTRGLIRQHQFNKVELVKFTLPEDSYNELEALTADAEDILQLLGLPYRVIKLCTGDLGFASAFTYDIEVWMPSYGRYVEISSCSNFEDFQARRAGIRFKRGQDKKPEFVHTLNGSGLAVGRTTACILETYQNADGSISIPDALKDYMGGMTQIK